MQLSQQALLDRFMPGEGDITDRIVDLLEENGGMDEGRYRILVLLALRDVLETTHSCKISLSEMQGKVKRLEDNSILLMAKAYKNVSVPLLVIILVITAYALVHFGLLDWALEYLNIPRP